MALLRSVGTCLLAMASIATAGDSSTDLHARLATATRQVTAMRYDLRTLPKARAAEFRELFVAHVMTLAELDAMEVRTGQAGKLANRQQMVDAAALLDQFADELTRAHDRHNALHRYFTDAPEMATRLDHWRKFARANSLAGNHYDDVERLARDLQAAVGRGDFPSAATNLIPAIRLALDQALVNGWITASERDGPPIRSASRTKPCPRAADTRRGYGLPPAGLARVPAVLDLDQTRFKRGDRVLQPTDTLHEVGLDLQLDREGCVLEASVRVSSGEPAIDSDALAWILNDANIEPAYLDGQAVGSHLRIRLRMW
ncbi:MAG: hypothetical protein R3E65_06340 [Steroidobacteraceae bacterium]